MQTTVEWRHPAGHIYLHAVLVLTKVTIRPESGVFEVDYGVWENASAFHMNAGPLHQGEMTYAIEDFPSLFDMLISVSRSLCEGIGNIVIPEEEN